MTDQKTRPNLQQNTDVIVFAAGSIILTGLYAHVQDVKAGKAGKKITRNNHIYRGLFRCGLCDSPMSPERQKGHVCYRCQEPNCPTKSPHRWRQFKLSNDPAFAKKLREVVGLYVAPPAHAVVLSVDEKSQIQALDRTQPGLPVKRGRGQTLTHDYKRNDTEAKPFIWRADPDEIIVARNRGFQMLDSIH